MIIRSVLAKTACLAAMALVPALRSQTTPAAATLQLEFTSALGIEYYSLPDEKGVVAEAQKNLAADPKNAGLLLKLAQAQVSVWQDREAVETLTRALAVSPENADLYTERGHRELPLREFKRALADLDRAVALNPKKMDAYYHLGLAHNADEHINSSNWLYASLRRAGQPREAAAALEQITPEMKNDAPHTEFYLRLVRVFQGGMSEDQALPPEPPANSSYTEAELRFDTVAYGVGNWHLYNQRPAKAREYFRRIVKGRVWITWGFVGAEVELLR